MGAVFAASMGNGVFTFTLPLMNLDEKAGGMWLGSGFAGYFLAKLLIAPLSGSYADTHGSSKPLLISCGLPSCFIALPTSPFHRNTLRDPIHPRTLRRNSTYSKYGRHRCCPGGNKLSSRFAMLSAVMNSSFLLGPLLGGLLYIDKDYLPVLGTMSAFMGLAFIIFTLCAKHLPTHTAEHDLTGERSARPRRFLSIMAALFGRGMGIGSLIAFYPVLLKSSLQLSPGSTALLFSIPSLTTVLLLPILGKLLAGLNAG